MLDEALAEKPDDARSWRPADPARGRRSTSGAATGGAPSRSPSKLLAREPRNVEALNFVGFVAADHAHDLPRALKRLQAAVALKPGTGGIVDSLGWAYFRAGDLARADSFLEQAGRLEPADPRSSSTSAISTPSARSATARSRPTSGR